MSLSLFTFLVSFIVIHTNVNARAAYFSKRREEESLGSHSEAISKDVSHGATTL